MSAFVVGSAHVRAMLRAAMAYGHDRGRFRWSYGPGEDGELRLDNANQVGQMLMDECVASVAHRYSDDTTAELPGSMDNLDPFQYPLTGHLPTPVEAIKLVHCYEYQSCEHEAWEASDAHRFTTALHDTLESALPGYDAAPWEWTK